MVEHDSTTVKRKEEQFEKRKAVRVKGRERRMDGKPHGR
jgi:hypothetical protein